MFIDIECVCQYASFEECPDKEIIQSLFNKQKEIFDIEEFYRTLVFDPAFSKIVCISTGYYSGSEFRAKTFVGEESLPEFADMLSKLNGYKLCGHYIKDFDIPFIAKRMLINGVKIPGMLKFFGKKPWEINWVLDTHEMWRWGSFKGGSSLNVLCYALGVESPKDAMDGADVHDAFYAGEIESIVEYCEKDIFAASQVYEKLCEG